jgi:hypothetical protein
MIVLHPFSRFRQSEQIETWKALEEIREHFRVIDVFVKDKEDYDDALLHLWGVDDLIIVEQDNVPSLELIRELTQCPNPWCSCWYWTRYMDDKLAAFKGENGFGFTKLSLEAQRLAPAASWYKRDDWAYYNLDSRVTSVLVQKGLAVHVHGEVKHNRAVDWTGKTK